MSMGLTVVYLTTCVFLIAIQCEGTEPGLKLRLSQNGLNYALKVGLDVLSARVTGQHIPDQSGSSHVGPGKVHYSLTGMRVTSFGRPSGKIVVNPGKGLTISLSGASVAVHGDWKYKYKVLITIRDHGSFDVSASGIGISMSVTLGKSSSGQPTIHSTSCSSTVGSVKVKFHGGASWLYNLFHKAVEKPIKKALVKVLCDEARKAVDVDAAKSLATMAVTVPVEHVLDLDYRLVNNPMFGSGYLESDHKGEFFWHGDKTEAPFNPPPMPDPHQTGGMVQLHVSPYILNTLGHVLQAKGLIQYKLTQKDLPPAEKQALNTSCSGLVCITNFIPQLKKFPHNTVNIQMHATQDPKVSVLPDEVDISFSGDFKYNLDQGNSNEKYLFTTAINATVKGTGNFQGNKLVGKVLGIKTELKVTDSAIGKISDGALNFLFKTASAFIIPKLNEMGQKGLAIPTLKHVGFDNPKTILLKDMIFVSVDVHYIKEDTKLYFCTIDNCTID